MCSILKTILDKKPKTATGQVALTMFCALLFGIFLVIISLFSSETVCRGLLWAGAWSSAGWFLGFLFGIPRFLSTDTARKPAALSQESSSEEIKMTAAVDVLREAAIKATEAKVSADIKARQAKDTSEKAKKDFELAAKNFNADQQNTSLKDEADAKAKSAEKMERISNEMAALVTTAAVKAEAATQLANDAAAAASNVKSKASRDSINAITTPGASLTVNTNLEQISDWLTKIIVGVSLVESQALLGKMQKAAELMAKSMVKADSSPSSTHASAPFVDAASAVATNGLDALASMGSFAYAVMLYFLSTGLLGSYLLTRLFLQKAFANAAQEIPKQ